MRSRWSGPALTRFVGSSSRRSSATAKRAAGGVPVIPHTSKAAEHRLTLLEADGLTYHYPSSVHGVADVALQIERGSFTMITERVGTSKTTLLRTVFGLCCRRTAGRSAGTARWWPLQ